MAPAYHVLAAAGESRTEWLVENSAAASQGAGGVGRPGCSGWHTGIMDGQPEAMIDLDAIQSNVAALCHHVGHAQLMAVVKSDGYGHGMLPSARAALAGGADWLGVVQLMDAIALRKAGLTVPVLSLHGSPDAPHAEAIRVGVDLTVGSVALLDQVALAAEGVGQPARVHLEADTGMGRGGATGADWPALVHAALAAEAAGLLRVVGLWSHFACADIVGHPSIDQQLAAFRDAVALAERAGARPEVRHLANGPATLTLPGSYFDLVRPGGSVFGLCTLPGGVPDWLRPAMTVRARLVQVKEVPAGAPVSYGHRYATGRPARLGVLPLGYNEGIPRLATNAVDLLSTRGRRVPIAGTVNLNHVVLDLGEGPAEAGDEVILFGPGDHGEATAQEWAEALGTISYEIVTRFTGKVPRTYCGVAAARDDASLAGPCTGARAGTDVHVSADVPAGGSELAGEARQAGTHVPVGTGSGADRRPDGEVAPTH
ncbi:MAG TPA: alanine racemase [Streptosporangiaceae bacterium]